MTGVFFNRKIVLYVLFSLRVLFAKYDPQIRELAKYKAGGITLTCISL